MYSANIVLAILIYILSLGVPSHAIYISVIDVKEEAISIKVFSDDLRDVLRNYSDTYVNMGFEEFTSTNQSLISDYFTDHFKIVINGESLKLQLIEIKKENDAHFLYFSIESPAVWKQIEVKGNFFIELFPDQSNILTITKDGEKYFSRLTKSNPKYAITF
jgi:hypothetical protein